MAPCRWGISDPSHSHAWTPRPCAAPTQGVSRGAFPALLLLCAYTSHLAQISFRDHQASCMHPLHTSSPACITSCMQQALHQCSTSCNAAACPVCWLGIADTPDPCRQEAMSHRAMFGGQGSQQQGLLAACIPQRGNAQLLIHIILLQAGFVLKNK